jgi:hypothetical protein
LYLSALCEIGNSVYAPEPERTHKINRIWQEFESHAMREELREADVRGVSVCVWLGKSDQMRKRTKERTGSK